MRTEGKQLQQGQTYLQAYEAQLKSTSFSFKNLGKSALSGLKALGAGAINALGGMAIGALVSGSISLISKGIDKLIVTEKERQEKLQEMASKAEEAKSNIESLTSSMSDHAKTVNDIKDRYAELSQGVDNLSNKNISLSTSEYEEFLDLTNQLSEIFPQLNRGIDDNGNAILNLNGDVNTITSSLESMLQVEKELANQKIAENASEYIKNTLPQLKEDYNKVNFDSLNYNVEKKVLESLLNIDGVLYKNLSDIFTNPNNLTFSKDSFTKYRAIKQELSKVGIDINKEIQRRNEADQWEYSVIEFTEEDKLAIERYYANFVTTTETEIKKSEAELARANQQISSMASYWYTSELSLKDQSGKAIYDNLQSADLQNAIQQMLNNVNWAELSIAGEWDSEQDVYDYITNNILMPLENVNPEIRESVYNNIIKAFTDTTLSSNEKLELLKNLQQQLSDLGITVDLSFKIKELETDRDVIKNQLGFNKNASNVYDAQRNQDINEFVNSLSDNDKTLWLNVEIPDSVKNGTKEDWEKFLNDLQETADETDILSFSEAWKNLETSSDEATKDLAKNLEEMAQKGQLTTEKFLELDSSDYFKNLGVSAEEAVEKINDLVDASTQLSVLSGQVSKMSDSLANKKNGVVNTADDLAGFDAEVRGLDSWKEFERVMLSSTSTMEECQKAADALATEWINNGNFLANLTEENKQAYITQLQKMGVDNAEAVVEYQLAKIKEEAALAQEYENAVKRSGIQASTDLASVTGGEIQRLLEEKAISIDTANSLAQLAVQKRIANGSRLDTSGDIKNLAALAGAGTKLGSLLNQLARIKQGFTNGMPSDVAEIQAKNLQKQINALLSGGSAANLNTGVNISSSGSGSYKGSGGGSSSGGSSSNTKKDPTTIDHIETAINRAEETISRFDKTVTNVYDNWSNRNKALSDEIGKVRSEIDLQQKAYQGYMNKANSIGLSDAYKQKVQNGAIQIEDIADENLAKKIEDYKTWYEKAIACKDAIQDLNITLGELAQTKFDNVEKEFSDLIDIIESQADIIDEKINNVEGRGYFASSEFYRKQIEYEQQVLNNLNNEYSSLIAKRNEAVRDGSIIQGSEQYQEMEKSILDVQKSIEESKTSIVELNNAIRDLNWEVFDYAEERISKITDEANFLIDAFSNYDLYNENGTFNDKANATAYLHGKNYEVYLQQSRDYAEEIKKINADLARDPSNKDLIERREELLDLQQESISNMYAEKNAIKSLVEDGVNKHLESLSELIDKYKESLNSAKD